MSRFGFVGPTYASQSLNADAQRCVNFYVENNESGEGKSARQLLPTPGLSLHVDLVGSQVRGELAINGRGFAVADATLYEILAAGKAAITAVGNDLLPVSMVASPQQLLLCSAGRVYVYYLQAVTAGGITIPAGTVKTIPIATFSGPVTQVGYGDGFFLALIANSQQFYVSNNFDATGWNLNGSKIISTYPENIVSMIVDHREIWLLGGKASEVDYPSGNIFPYDTVPGGFIEQGCAAQFATVNLDNSIMWIGTRSDQGGGIAWRAQGYTPARISNHAVETAWQGYATISDARAFAYQDQGHSFWVITFPTANKTWVYDVATGMWHERDFLNTNTGAREAALPQCHMYLFGKHLVGDRKSGKIYQMSIPTVTGGGWNFVTDNGSPIRRVRRAPHISTENQWINHVKLTIDIETGIGPQPPLYDGAGNPRGPVVTLKYSDDGGHIFKNGQDKEIGMTGEYSKRIEFRRLGRSRSRVYQLECSDPVPYRIIDAYLTANPGFQPQERISKQMAKVS